ncbi:MAG: zf-HC2 domain-containing protein [Gemmatimonadales bacterium]
MSHHPIEAVLNALADGTLEAADRAAVERHVAQCLACRRVVNGLRALLAGVAALPREIAPARDLWAGIEDRLGKGEGGRVPRPTARLPDRPTARPPDRPSARPPVRRFWLAAAAAVLALLATGTALVLLRDVPVPQIADRPSARPPDRLGWVVLEGEYSRAADEVALGPDRGALAPEAIAVVDAGLRVVDQAIAESRAALARDPDSAELARLVASAYESKIDLLRWAGRLAASD